MAHSGDGAASPPRDLGDRLAAAMRTLTRGPGAPFTRAQGLDALLLIFTRLPPDAERPVPRALRARLQEIAVTLDGQGGNLLDLLDVPPVLLDALLRTLSKSGDLRAHQAASLVTGGVPTPQVQPPVPLADRQTGLQVRFAAAVQARPRRGS